MSASWSVHYQARMVTQRQKALARLPATGDTPARAGASLPRASLLPGHSSVQGFGLSTERELRADGLARCTCTENQHNINSSHRDHTPSPFFVAAGGTGVHAGATLLHMSMLRAVPAGSPQTRPGAPAMRR